MNSMYLENSQTSDRFGEQKSGSGRVRVPKKSGFPPGFRVFSYKSNQKSGSGPVRVLFLGLGSDSKKVGFFPRVFGFSDTRTQHYLSLLPFEVFDNK